MSTRRINNNWLAVLLIAPMLLLFLAYWFHHAPGLTPTGFIQPDNVSYLAYGKQYLDNGMSSLFYSNPFNENNTYQPIYFQPQTLLFALLLNGPIPVVVLLPLFTMLFTWLGFRRLIAVYDLLLPQNKFRTFHLTLLCWGGGLLALAGVPIHLFYNTSDIHFLDGILYLDPAAGWWGLNWGRAQFFSCEAYYHFLFISAIYYLLREKWAGALILILLTSLSHPFTGIELLVIAGLWIGQELLYKKRRFPLWFAGGILLILVFHLWYYLLYLNQFPEHRSVAEQYSLPWKLRYFNMLPAYCLVGLLALGTLLNQGFKTFYSHPSVRLLCCWFLGAFLLANHELLLPVSMQPIHFTRGYIWTSLFLLGLPMLHKLSSSIVSRYHWSVLVVLGLIFCSDNIAWLTNFIRSKPDVPSTGYITAEQRDIFRTADSTCNATALLITDDRDMGYLSTIYTKANPLVSHPFTTPFVKTKEAQWNDLLRSGTIQSKWMGRPVCLLLRKENNWPGLTLLLNRYNLRVIKETPHYRLINTDSLVSKPDLLN